MTFQKVESPSKSLLFVAPRPVFCWSQRQLCKLSSDRSLERTSQARAACSRSASSLGQCDPGKQNLPDSLYLMLCGLFCSSLLLLVGDPCMGIPVGGSFAARIFLWPLSRCTCQRGLSLSASPFLLQVSTWLLHCFLNITFQISYTLISQQFSCKTSPWLGATTGSLQLLCSCFEHKFAYPLIKKCRFWKLIPRI